MTRVLALDCALTASAGAVVVDGAGAPVARIVRKDDGPRGLAEALMPLAVEALAAAGLGFADLDAVAVTIGPGSFAGLRAGIAAARGIALARAIPVLGVTTLEAIAVTALAGTPGATVIAIVDSRRGDLYVQAFRNDALGLPAALAAPEARAPDAIAAMIPAAGPVVVAGEVDKIGDAIGGALARADVALHPVATLDPVAVGLLARRRLEAGLGDRAPPRPVYLQPPRASLPEAGGRLRR
ncbi:MAG: tRNA (adenosine(37)-N6)-threonylcarbamoyltransferase complex dimerization subunit type 1 TsaB [Alphaproteobacteria bacterium]|nr:tRNA (adenosine(37)-N6)-threonylcarbamoyltransferase complex dimerization subunit type 1 TsaB [Alphaproteobacteria bacterium]